MGQIRLHTDDIKDLIDKGDIEVIGDKMYLNGAEVKETGFKHRADAIPGTSKSVERREAAQKEAAEAPKAEKPVKKAKKKAKKKVK